MASSPKYKPPDPTQSVKPDGCAIEKSTYDIFSGESDKDAVWLDVVVGIEQARIRVQQIADADPGKYFIFDSHSGGIIARIDTEQGGKAKPQSGVA